MNLPRLLLLCLCCLPLLVRASPSTPLPATVTAALKAAGIPISHVAVLVQEVDAATAKVAFNADQPMNPASVMKLLPTYAALELLGPAYTWKTTALTDAPPTDGRLDGNLYLQGSGDPKLTYEQFWLLLRQLRARGIRDIGGDLVLDRSILALPPHDPAAFDNKPLRPYNVGPDALLLAFKSLRVQLWPSPDGKRLTVAAEPQPSNLDFTSLIRISGGPCGDWQEGLRADATRHGERTRLVLTGDYPASCGERTWNISVLDHPDYVLGVFRQLWKELGGTLAGGVRDAPIPATALAVASIESPTLGELVRDINKFSNNVMARQLYLSLGVATGARPARAEDAEAALRGWLERKRIACPNLILDNGAGLSRRERIDAACLGNLLAAAWKSPLMPEFIASLPLPAVDGTMKKRLREDGVAGQAHIKTGSIEGVKAIAGYVDDRRGRRQIVVFLVNDPNAGAARAAQDALLEWVWDVRDR